MSENTYMEKVYVSALSLLDLCETLDHGHLDRRVCGVNEEEDDGDVVFFNAFLHSGLILQVHLERMGVVQLPDLLSLRIRSNESKQLIV